jgi:ADP-ribose pyrophosphatase YjhB (NUDIX family)
VSDFARYSGRVRVRAAALVVRDGSLLLVKQKVPTRDNLIWLPLGGGLQLGETAETALVREVKEETGITVIPESLRYVHEFIQPPFHSIELYYLSGFKSGSLVTGNDPEHHPARQLIEEVKWISLQEAASIDLFPEFLLEEIKKDTLFKKEISHFRTV